jgi:hypothetical protein
VNPILKITRNYKHNDLQLNCNFFSTSAFHTCTDCGIAPCIVFPHVVRFFPSRPDNWSGSPVHKYLARPQVLFYSSSFSVDGNLPIINQSIIGLARRWFSAVESLRRPYSPGPCLMIDAAASAFYLHCAGRTWAVLAAATETFSSAWESAVILHEHD